MSSEKISKKDNLRKRVIEYLVKEMESGAVESCFKRNLPIP